MLKSIVIDDERKSRQLLKTLIKEYCQGIEVVGDAASVSTGIEIINNENPDLIFLDIEMPGGDGFTLLETFKKANFLTCFVTGYSQYAIKAIKHGAFDYLLKPVEISELQLTVAKGH